MALFVGWIELPPTRRPETAEALCASVVRIYFLAVTISGLLLRDNQAHAATMPGINLGLHLFAIVSFERMPVKPGLSGHRLRRLRA